MKTVQAVYKNGVFRPSDPVDLPENSEVRLTIEAKLPAAKGQGSLAELAEIARQYPDNPDLPTDLAAQHDHYLYGTPKRQ